MGPGASRTNHRSAPCCCLWLRCSSAPLSFLCPATEVINPRTEELQALLKQACWVCWPLSDACKEQYWGDITEKGENKWRGLQLKASESCAHMSNSQLPAPAQVAGQPLALLLCSVQRSCAAPGIQFSSLVCSKVNCCGAMLGRDRWLDDRKHGENGSMKLHGKQTVTMSWPKWESSWAAVSQFLLADWSPPLFALWDAALPLAVCAVGWRRSQIAAMKWLKTSLFFLLRLFLPGSGCVVAAKGLVLQTGGWWEHAGGPGFTRLTFVAQRCGRAAPCWQLG